MSLRFAKVSAGPLTQQFSVPCVWHPRDEATTHLAFSHLLSPGLAVV